MKFNFRKNTVILDIECYPNYFLVAFRNVHKPTQTKHFEMRNNRDKLDCDEIKRWLRSCTIITFNGNHYDIPLLMYALQGNNCTELKDASDLLIGDKERGIKGMQSWEFLKAFELGIPSYLDHVDIFSIPAGKLSLKTYAARIGCKKLQDLPIDPFAFLTEQEKDEIARYCDNDTTNTLDLYNVLKPKIDLRIDMSNEYGIDMRSKSDAQVGEALFKYFIEKETKQRLFKPEFHKVKRKFKYDIPDFIHFEHPTLKKLYSILEKCTFTLGSNGHVDLPQELADLKIQINNGLYTVGIGGLHSNENEQSIVADYDEVIMDADVGSYYPSIIIEGGYYPDNCGLPFLRKFTMFRDDRLDIKDYFSVMKKQGKDKAVEKYKNAWWINLPDDKKNNIIETYKIALNGSFGKLSSIFSFLFDAKMLIQVTLTGQLCLLMLIERIEKQGLRIISANTDGIVIYGKEADLHKAKHQIALWEIETNFKMEYTHYLQIHSQNVNSYLALTTDGKWKRKGEYAARGLTQSGNNQVCIDAVMQFLEHGTPIRETIEECTNFLKFTNFQQVKGGAYKDGVYLGKVVRWYHSTSTNTNITNAKGNSVPVTQGAMPAMDLPDEMPDDINFNWYVREAYEMLKRLGVTNVERDKKAFGLSDKKAFKWARKEGQATYHLIDMTTKQACCEARLKGHHDEWDYVEHLPQNGRICGKCKKKDV